MAVNCAGIASGKIAALFGDDIKVSARKGEYILLDRESGDFVKHTLFFTPTKLGKGILVTQTADNNILLGPTAEEEEIPDTATSAEGLKFVQEKVRKMCKNPPLFNTITSFAGVRAYSDRHDFIIETSEHAEGVIHLAGIESPGLTASPAIAEYVVRELAGKFLPLENNEKFNGERKADYFFKNLSVGEKNEMIKRDPSYGKSSVVANRSPKGNSARDPRESARMRYRRRKTPYACGNGQVPGRFLSAARGGTDRERAGDSARFCDEMRGRFLSVERGDEMKENRKEKA